MVTYATFNELFGGLFDDTDGDGFPGFWEEQYFGGPTAADANADPDHRRNRALDLARKLER